MGFMIQPVHSTSNTKEFCSSLDVSALCGRAVIGTSYKSHKSADNDLKKRIIQLLADKLDADHYYQQRVIGCGDGTVLIVKYSGHGKFAYDICGPGRKHRSGCMGAPTFDQCCIDARKHADQCFGGVKWENS